MPTLNSKRKGRIQSQKSTAFLPYSARFPARCTPSGWACRIYVPRPAGTGYPPSLDEVAPANIEETSACPPLALAPDDNRGTDAFFRSRSNFRGDVRHETSASVLHDEGSGTRHREAREIDGTVARGCSGGDPFVELGYGGLGHAQGTGRHDRDHPVAGSSKNELFR